MKKNNMKIISADGLANIQKNPKADWQKRLIIFTPSRGLIRIEWAMARYGQIIPTNWSNVEMFQFLSPYVPLEYQLADAQNLLAKKVVEDNYEWVVYIEDDNIIPPDLFVRLNQYINDGKIPVVSGVYFTKGNPSEPILYRGRGNSYFRNWKFGDKVWVDGIPFGCRLEHASLIKAAWEESPEYQVGSITTRRVFESPGMMWYDENKGGMVAKRGTSDLAWCSRIMEDKLFEKAGWSEYQKKKYPFLVDTEISVKHIDQNGIVYPRVVPKEFIPPKNYKSKEIK